MRTLKHPSQAVFAMCLVACLLLSSAKAVLAQNLESRHTAIHLSVHQASQPQDEPLVSIVQKDVIVEEILRELAQINSLDLIYLGDQTPRCQTGLATSPADVSAQTPAKTEAASQADKVPATDCVQQRRSLPFLEIKNLSAHAAFEQVLKMSDLSARRLNSSLLVTERENPPDKLIRAYSITSKTAMADVPPMGGITGENRPLIMQQMTAIYRSRGFNPLPDMRYDKTSSIMVIQGTEEAMDIADRLIPILTRTWPHVAVDMQWIELSQSASKALGISDKMADCKQENNSSKTCLMPPTGLMPANGDATRTAFIVDPISEFVPDFDAKLNQLILNQQASVLAGTRLTIQHGIPATIDSTTPFPASPATATKIPHPITSLDISEKLNITPFIDTEKHEVTIRMRPEISIRGPLIETHPTRGCSPAYRTLETVKTLSDGESVIISGYQRKRYSETISKLPFLGDLPFLDAVFSSTDKYEEDVEIIMILTPHILKSP